MGGGETTEDCFQFTSIDCASIWGKALGRPSVVFLRRSSVLELEGILALVWSRLITKVNNQQSTPVQGHRECQHLRLPSFFIFVQSTVSTLSSYCFPFNRLTWFHRLIHFCILLGTFWNLVTPRLVWFSSDTPTNLGWVFWLAEAKEVCIVLGFGGTGVVLDYEVAFAWRPCSGRGDQWVFASFHRVHCVVWGHGLWIMSWLCHLTTR